MTYDSQRDILYLVAEGYLSGLSQPNREGLNLPSKLVRVNDAGHIAVDFIGQRLYWIESGTMVCAYVCMYVCMYVCTCMYV